MNQIYLFSEEITSSSFSSLLPVRSTPLSPSSSSSPSTFSGESSKSASTSERSDRNNRIKNSKSKNKKEHKERKIKNDNENEHFIGEKLKNNDEMNKKENEIKNGQDKQTRNLFHGKERCLDVTEHENEKQVEKEEEEKLFQNSEEFNIINDNLIKSIMSAKRLKEVEKGSGKKSEEDLFLMATLSSSDLLLSVIEKQQKILQDNQILLMQQRHSKMILRQSNEEQINKMKHSDALSTLTSISTGSERGSERGSAGGGVDMDDVLNNLNKSNKKINNENNNEIETSNYTYNYVDYNDKNNNININMNNRNDGNNNRYDNNELFNALGIDLFESSQNSPAKEIKSNKFETNPHNIVNHLTINDRENLRRKTLDRHNNALINEKIEKEREVERVFREREIYNDPNQIRKNNNYNGNNIFLDVENILRKYDDIDIENQKSSSKHNLEKKYSDDSEIFGKNNNENNLNSTEKSKFEFSCTHDTNRVMLSCENLEQKNVHGDINVIKNENDMIDDKNNFRINSQFRRKFSYQDRVLDGDKNDENKWTITSNSLLDSHRDGNKKVDNLNSNNDGNDNNNNNCDNNMVDMKSNVRNANINENRSKDDDNNTVKKNDIQHNNKSHINTSNSYTYRGMNINTNIVDTTGYTNGEGTLGRVSPLSISSRQSPYNMPPTHPFSTRTATQPHTQQQQQQHTQTAQNKPLPPFSPGTYLLNLPYSESPAQPYVNLLSSRSSVLPAPTLPSPTLQSVPDTHPYAYTSYIPPPLHSSLPSPLPLSSPLSPPLSSAHALLSSSLHPPTSPTLSDHTTEQGTLASPRTHQHQATTSSLPHYPVNFDGNLRPTRPKNKHTHSLGKELPITQSNFIVPESPKILPNSSTYVSNTTSPVPKSSTLIPNDSLRYSISDAYRNVHCDSCTDISCHGCKVISNFDEARIHQNDGKNIGNNFFSNRIVGEQKVSENKNIKEHENMYENNYVNIYENKHEVRNVNENENENENEKKNIHTNQYDNKFENEDGTIFHSYSSEYENRRKEKGNQDKYLSALKKDLINGMGVSVFDTMINDISDDSYDSKIRKQMNKFDLFPDHDIDLCKNRRNDGNDSDHNITQSNDITGISDSLFAEFRPINNGNTSKVGNFGRNTSYGEIRKEIDEMDSRAKKSGPYPTEKKLNSRLFISPKMSMGSGLISLSDESDASDMSARKKREHDLYNKGKVTEGDNYIDNDDSSISVDIVKRRDMICRDDNSSGQNSNYTPTSNSNDSRGRFYVQSRLEHYEKQREKIRNLSFLRKLKADMEDNNNNTEKMKYDSLESYDNKNLDDESVTDNDNEKIESYKLIENYSDEYCEEKKENYQKGNEIKILRQKLKEANKKMKMLEAVENLRDEESTENGNTEKKTEKVGKTEKVAGIFDLENQISVQKSIFYDDDGKSIFDHEEDDDEIINILNREIKNDKNAISHLHSQDRKNIIDYLSRNGKVRKKMLLKYEIDRKEKERSYLKTIINQKERENKFCQIEKEKRMAMRHQIKMKEHQKELLEQQKRDCEKLNHFIKEEKERSRSAKDDADKEAEKEKEIDDEKYYNEMNKILEREKEEIKKKEMKISTRLRKSNAENKKNIITEASELKEQNDRIEKEKDDVYFDIDIEFDDVDNIVKLLHRKIVERTHKLTQINLAKFRRQEKEKINQT